MNVLYVANQKCVITGFSKLVGNGVYIIFRGNKIIISNKKENMIEKQYFTELYKGVITDMTIIKRIKILNKTEFNFIYVDDFYISV